MFPAVGLVLLFVLVFGGFALSGGALGPVFAAMPIEMLIIGGSAVASLVVGNSAHHLKALGGGFGRIFKGPRYSPEDHIAAIAVVGKLMRTLKADGPVALESHVMDPENSTIFAEYPGILKSHEVTSLICDTLTLMVVSSGSLETHAIEDIMDNAIKSYLHEMDEPAHAIQNLADALPALGIVAAVLGIVKTMGSIDQPPEVLGKMIGAALVGTFLGVLLAYGAVGPLASRLKQINAEDAQIFNSVKQVLIASLHGYPHAMAVEAARSGLPHAIRPPLIQLLDELKGR